MCTMHKSKKINMGEVNPHLLCVLCGGYFIDATTIIECLHSFCRTCLVRHLETNKTCPICEVLIHKTRPHQNIRSDKTLQDIVYKLVPGLYKNEMKRRREFYDQYPIKDDCKTPSEERGDEMAERFIFTENEKISLALEYWIDGIQENLESEKKPEKPEKQELPDETKTQKRDVRYLQCPGALTVAHLKKFIRLKFELPHRCRIDIYHQKEILSDYYTLLDIACIFSWKRMEPLRLYYTIYENIIRKRKVEQIDNKVVISEEAETKTSTTDQTEPKPIIPEEKRDDESITTAVAPTDEHKFLTPTTSKVCSNLPAKQCNPQQVPILPKLANHSNGKSTVKEGGPSPQKQVVPETQKSINSTSQKTQASNTKIVTQQSTNKTVASKPTTSHPARIAPKLPTNIQPMKTVKQQIESKQANQQPLSKVVVTDKTQTSLHIPRSPVLIKASNVGRNQSNKQTPSTLEPTRPTQTVNTLTAQHKMPGQVPQAASTQQHNSKKITERNQNITQFAAQKTISPLLKKSTDTTSKVNPSTNNAPQAPNISKEPLPKLNGSDIKSPSQITNTGKDMNGGRKTTNIDMTSLPEGAVIRSMKSPFTGTQKPKNDVIAPKTTTQELSNKKNVIEKKIEGNLTDDAKTSLKKSTVGENPTKNNKVGDSQPNPKLNGCTRPGTPKLNGGSRPSTPKVNNGSRPSTPKTNGNSRPSTPKLNGNSRPATPKIQDACRPTTPKVNGDVRSFKPIAPKLPASKNGGVCESGNKGKGVELQIPMNYSKGQAEKRTMPMMDSSSSDICEEIRQRKLARMDEPLNLVKRDQDKNKPVSPINGNVSPRNNLQMIVGSAGI